MITFENIYATKEEIIVKRILAKRKFTYARPFFEKKFSTLSRSTENGNVSFDLFKAYAVDTDLKKCVVWFAWWFCI